MRAHGWCSGSSTNWREKGERIVAQGCRAVCGRPAAFSSYDQKAAGPRQNRALALRYVRCLITRVSLQITATPLERSSVRIAASIRTFVFLRYVRIRVCLRAPFV